MLHTIYGKVLNILVPPYDQHAPAHADGAWVHMMSYHERIIIANSSSYKVCYTQMYCWDYIEEWNRHVLPPSPPVCTKMDGSIMLRSSLACIWTCSKYWETIHCNVHLCRSLVLSQENSFDMHQCTCIPRSPYTKLPSKSMKAEVSRGIWPPYLYQHEKWCTWEVVQC